jgi:hypothetical protein
MKMTRQEHLEWCKKRALEYLDKGDIPNAIASMMSDMQKHEETKFNNPMLNLLGLRAAQCGDREEARRYIVGFN